MNAIAVQVRFAATKRLLFLPHAVKQMSRPERMITVDEVKQTVLRGKVIEDYPEDVRGHSCLIAKLVGPGRAVHVVCSPKEDYVAIITAYVPEAEMWDSRFEVRREP